MLEIRRSEDRGHVTHGWLETHHSFSFGSYHDPKHMGFRALRVLNDDIIAPGTGFGPHPHEDMEIVSYVVDGALEHRDSMGNGSIIRPGDVQRMSAGRGVVHSERNPSGDEAVRLLQIWIEPQRGGREPSYEQRHFESTERAGRLRLVASQNGRDGSVRVDADVSLYSALLSAGDVVDLPLAAEPHAWIQVVSGEVEVRSEASAVRLRHGDGAAIDRESHLKIEGCEGNDDSEVLVFDLA